MKKIYFIILCFVAIILTSANQNTLNNVQFVKHIGYTTYYNHTYNIPDLVTYELVKSELTKNTTTRTNIFIPDPNIIGCCESSDYNKSGYDKGHMAPAADMKWSKKAMDESFYMSNVCPQSPKLNRGKWLKLEELVRTISMKTDTVWISVGPIVRNNPKTIGKHKVAVPYAFYKAIVWKENGEYVGAGFIMNNEKCDGYLVNYIKDIDNIEKMIGYDLFNWLPDDIENKIESGKEKDKVYQLIYKYEKKQKN